MKYTWEQEDITAGRRIVSYNDTEEYIITYSTRHSQDFMNAVPAYLSFHDRQEKRRELDKLINDGKDPHKIWG